MQLYDNQLKCDDSVREISLVDLPGVEINDDTMTKCIWYDTQGGEFPEQISESIDGVQITMIWNYSCQGTY